MSILFVMCWYTVMNFIEAFLWALPAEVEVRMLCCDE